MNIEPKHKKPKKTKIKKKKITVWGAQIVIKMEIILKVLIKSGSLKNITLKNRQMPMKHSPIANYPRFLIKSSWFPSRCSMPKRYFHKLIHQLEDTKIPYLENKANNILVLPDATPPPTIIFINFTLYWKKKSK